MEVDLADTASWRRVLTDRDFRLLFGGQLLSLLGDWSNNVGLLVLTYQITNSAFATGLIFAFKTAPRLLFLPFGGWAADRVDRRRLMIAMDILRTPLALLPILAHDQGSLWLMWVSVFSIQVCSSFFTPSRVPLTAFIFRERTDQLPHANALLAMTNQLALAAGPVLGSFVLLSLGVDAIFLLNALTFVASAVLLTAMRVREAEGRISAGIGWRTATQGARTVFGHAGLCALVLGMGISGGMVFLFQANIPNLATALDAVERGSGLMLAAVGVGAFVGARVSPDLIRDEGRLRAALAVSLIVLVVAAGVPILAVVLALLFVNGAGTVIVDLGITRQVQALDAGLQGRVMGFYLVVISFGQLVGALAAGVLAPLGVLGAEIVLGTVLVGAAVLVDRVAATARSRARAALAL